MLTLNNLTLQNFLRRNWMLRQPLLYLLCLLVAQASCFLIHSYHLTQSVRPSMITYHSLCSIWRFMERYATPEVTMCFPPTLFAVSATDLRERFLFFGVFYLTLLMPWEAEDFPRGDRHFKHVPLLTDLIYLSPK